MAMASFSVIDSWGRSNIIKIRRFCCAPSSFISPNEPICMVLHGSHLSITLDEHRSSHGTTSCRSAEWLVIIKPSVETWFHPVHMMWCDAELGLEKQSWRSVRMSLSRPRVSVMEVSVLLPRKGTIHLGSWRRQAMCNYLVSAYRISEMNGAL